MSYESEKTLQGSRGFVNRVKLNGTTYSQRTDGVWAIYEGGEYRIVDDELNENENFRLQLLADIKNEKIKPSGWYPKNKKRIPVYSRENPNKANTTEYVDKDGNFLTQEQIKAYHDFKSTKNEDKKKAARKRLDTIGKKKNTKREVKKEADSSQEVKDTNKPMSKKTLKIESITYSPKDGFEIMFITRKGEKKIGKYIKTEKEDVINYTLDHRSFGLIITPENLGLTIDELIGSKDGYATEQGYLDTVEEYSDGVIVDQISLKPDSTKGFVVMVQTSAQGMSYLEGDAAFRIYERFLEWAELKEDKKPQPANTQKPSGKRGIIPGQNIQKQTSGNPVIDNITNTLPRVSPKWMATNKLNKQTLSNILTDLLEKDKISSDLLSEVLSAMYARDVEKTNSLLDNIMKCR